MSTKNRISKALAVVMPAGAVGASLLLALSSAQAATAPDASTTPSTHRPGVAARLEAIRAGISETNDTGLIPVWWGNGGWGRWHAGWGNGGWRFGWHNGGWGNGGWGNGGWGNAGWHNGGWGNAGWGNGGWHNYWHNN